MSESNKSKVCISKHGGYTSAELIQEVIERLGFTYYDAIKKLIQNPEEGKYGPNKSQLCEYLGLPSNEARPKNLNRESSELERQKFKNSNIFGKKLYDQILEIIIKKEPGTPGNTAGDERKITQRSKLLNIMNDKYPNLKDGGLFNNYNVSVLTTFVNSFRPEEPKIANIELASKELDLIKLKLATENEKPKETTDEERAKINNGCNIIKETDYDSIDLLKYENMLLNIFSDCAKKQIDLQNAAISKIYLQEYQTLSKSKPDMVSTPICDKPKTEEISMYTHIINKLKELNEKKQSIMLYQEYGKDEETDKRAIINLELSSKLGDKILDIYRHIKKETDDFSDISKVIYFLNIFNLELKTLVKESVSSLGKLLEIFPILKYQLYNLIIKSNRLVMNNESTIGNVRKILTFYNLSFIVDDLIHKVTVFYIKNILGDNILRTILVRPGEFLEENVKKIHVIVERLKQAGELISDVEIRQNINYILSIIGFGNIFNNLLDTYNSSELKSIIIGMDDALSYFLDKTSKLNKLTEKLYVDLAFGISDVFRRTSLEVHNIQELLSYNLIIDNIDGILEYITVGNVKQKIEHIFKSLTDIDIDRYKDIIDASSSLLLLKRTVVYDFLVDVMSFGNRSTISIKEYIDPFLNISTENGQKLVDKLYSTILKIKELSSDNVKGLIEKILEQKDKFIPLKSFAKQIANYGKKLYENIENINEKAPSILNIVKPIFSNLTLSKFALLYNTYKPAQYRLNENIWEQLGGFDVKNIGTSINKIISMFIHQSMKKYKTISTDNKKNIETLQNVAIPAIGLLYSLFDYENTGNIVLAYTNQIVSTCSSEISKSRFEHCVKNETFYILTNFLERTFTTLREFIADNFKPKDTIYTAVSFIDGLTPDKKKEYAQQIVDAIYQLLKKMLDWSNDEEYEKKEEETELTDEFGITGELLNMKKYMINLFLIVTQLVPAIKEQEDYFRFFIDVMFVVLFNIEKQDGKFLLANQFIFAYMKNLSDPSSDIYRAIMAHDLLKIVLSFIQITTSSFPTLLLKYFQILDSAVKDTPFAENWMMIVGKKLKYPIMGEAEVDTISNMVLEQPIYNNFNKGPGVRRLIKKVQKIKFPASVGQVHDFKTSNEIELVYDGFDEKFRHKVEHITQSDPAYNINKYMYYQALIKSYKEELSKYRKDLKTVFDTLNTTVLDNFYIEFLKKIEWNTFHIDFKKATSDYKEIKQEHTALQVLHRRAIKKEIPADRVDRNRLKELTILRDKKDAYEQILDIIMYYSVKSKDSLYSLEFMKENNSGLAKLFDLKLNAMIGNTYIRNNIYPKFLKKVLLIQIWLEETEIIVYGENIAEALKNLYEHKETTTTSRINKSKLLDHILYEYTIKKLETTYNEYFDKQINGNLFKVTVDDIKELLSIVIPTISFIDERDDIPILDIILNKQVGGNAILIKAITAIKANTRKAHSITDMSNIPVINISSGLAPPPRPTPGTQSAERVPARVGAQGLLYPLSGGGGNPYEDMAKILNNIPTLDITLKEMIQKYIIENSAENFQQNDNTPILKFMNLIIKDKLFSSYFTPIIESYTLLVYGKKSNKLSDNDDLFRLAKSLQCMLCTYDFDRTLISTETDFFLTKQTVKDKNLAEDFSKNIIDRFITTYTGKDNTNNILKQFYDVSYKEKIANIFTTPIENIKKYYEPISDVVNVNVIPKTIKKMEGIIKELEVDGGLANYIIMYKNIQHKIKELTTECKTISDSENFQNYKAYIESNQRNYNASIKKQFIQKYVIKFVKIRSRMGLCIEKSVLPDSIKEVVQVYNQKGFDKELMKKISTYEEVVSCKIKDVSNEFNLWSELISTNEGKYLYDYPKTGSIEKYEKYDTGLNGSSNYGKFCIKVADIMKTFDVKKTDDVAEPNASIKFYDGVKPLYPENKPDVEFIDFSKKDTKIKINPGFYTAMIQELMPGKTLGNLDKLEMSEDELNCLERASLKFFSIFFSTIIIEGKFHGDPHPGNLMWNYEKDEFDETSNQKIGQLSVIDFGDWVTIEEDKRMALLCIVLFLLVVWNNPYPDVLNKVFLCQQFSSIMVELLGLENYDNETLYKFYTNNHFYKSGDDILSLEYLISQNYDIKQKIIKTCKYGFADRIADRLMISYDKIIKQTEGGSVAGALSFIGIELFDNVFYELNNIHSDNDEEQNCEKFGQRVYKLVESIIKLYEFKKYVNIDLSLIVNLVFELMYDIVNKTLDEGTDDNIKYMANISTIKNMVLLLISDSIVDKVKVGSKMLPALIGTGTNIAYNYVKDWLSKTRLAKAVTAVTRTVTSAVTTAVSPIASVARATEVNLRIIKEAILYPFFKNKDSFDTAEEDYFNQFSSETEPYTKLCVPISNAEADYKEKIIDNLVFQKNKNNAIHLIDVFINFFKQSISILVKNNKFNITPEKIKIFLDASNSFFSSISNQIINVNLLEYINSDYTSNTPNSYTSFIQNNRDIYNSIQIKPSIQNSLYEYLTKISNVPETLSDAEKARISNIASKMKEIIDTKNKIKSDKKNKEKEEFRFKKITNIINSESEKIKKIEDIITRKLTISKTNVTFIDFINKEVDREEKVYKRVGITDSKLLIALLEKYNTLLSENMLQSKINQSRTIIDTLTASINSNELALVGYLPAYIKQKITEFNNSDFSFTMNHRNIYTFQNEIVKHLVNVVKSLYYGDDDKIISNSVKEANLINVIQAQVQQYTASLYEEQIFVKDLYIKNNDQICLSVDINQKNMDISILKKEIDDIQLQISKDIKSIQKIEKKLAELNGKTGVGIAGYRDKYTAEKTTLETRRESNKVDRNGKTGQLLNKIKETCETQNEFINNLKQQNSTSDPKEFTVFLKYADGIFSNTTEQYATHKFKCIVRVSKELYDGFIENKNFREAEKDYILKKYKIIRETILARTNYQSDVNSHRRNPEPTLLGDPDDHFEYLEAKGALFNFFNDTDNNNNAKLYDLISAN